MRSDISTPSTASLSDVARGSHQAICEDHGPFEQRITVILDREFRTGCPECTSIRRAQEEAEQAETAARDRRMAMARKLGGALIPKRFADRSLSEYRATNPGQKEALRVCRKYSEQFASISETGRCLLLLGKPGTGKTHLAVGIANEIMRTTTGTAIYRTFGAVLQTIRATYDKTSTQSEADIIASLVEPSLLILDEIGVTKQQPSDFELTTMFSVINGRYEQLRPTVIISNLEAHELPIAIGDRCMDRLREGGGIAVKFDWESQRGKEGF
jgi:DNA replication protein DnaC